MRMEGDDIVIIRYFSRRLLIFVLRHNWAVALLGGLRGKSMKILFSVAGVMLTIHGAPITN